MFSNAAHNATARTWLVRWCIAPLLVLAFLAQSAMPAGAQASARININSGDPWPFPPGTNGARTGMVCNTVWWSRSFLTGLVQTSWHWDINTDGQLNYNCEAVGLPGLYDTSRISSLSVCTSAVGEPAMSVAVPYNGNNNATGLTFPLTRLGAYQRNIGGTCIGTNTGVTTAAFQFQEVQHSIGGTTSAWYRMSGQVTFLHGCDPGDSGSCGSHPSITPGWTSDDPDPFGTSGVSSCNLHFYSQGYNNAASDVSTLTSNVPNGNACNSEAGLGNADFAPVRPDGSAVPSSVTGTCALSALNVLRWNDSTHAYDTAVGTDHGFFVIASGGKVEISFVAAWPATQSVSARVTINAYDSGSGTPDFSLPPVNVVTATPELRNAPATSRYDFVGPFTGWYSVKVACNVVGGGDTGDVFVYKQTDTTGDGYHGPPSGAPGPGCLVPPCTTPVDNGSDGLPAPGDFGRFTSCFTGLFGTVDFLGVSVPWVNGLLELPGDVACGVTALLVPHSQDWKDLWDMAKVGWQSSVLGSVTSFFLVPYQAVTNFASAADSGGCDGPVLTMPLMGTTYSWQPFNACNPPLDHVAGTIKFGLGDIAVGGVMYYSVQIVLGMLGFGGFFGGKVPEDDGAKGES